MQTNFADTILNITVTGGLIRIDLGTVTPQGQDQDGKPILKATHTQQLVMPLDGFVRSIGMQEQVINKLLADGVLKASPATTSSSQVSPDGSGN